MAREKCSGKKLIIFEFNTTLINAVHLLEEI